MKLLVTGGCGFIGSHFVKMLLKEKIKVLNVDSLTYAADLENIGNYSSWPDYEFIKKDISDSDIVDMLDHIKFDGIINFAAESHVDRSITNPADFITTNVVGTHNMLKMAHKRKIRILQVSTDEVYGSTIGDAHWEGSLLDPSSPYSASKASADLLVNSYCKTFGVDAVITRSSNNFGPNQDDTKLIPKVIMNAYSDKEIPIYGDGIYFRDWIHVQDNCEAIFKVFKQGRSSYIYNIGSGRVRMNLDIVKFILDYLGKPKDLIEFVEDRPGHDKGYCIDCHKIKKEIGWEPKLEFYKSLEQTIDWYVKKIYEDELSCTITK